MENSEKEKYPATGALREWLAAAGVDTSTWALAKLKH